MCWFKGVNVYVCVWGEQVKKGNSFLLHCAVFPIRCGHLKWKCWLKHPFGRKSLKFRSFSSHDVSKRVRFKFHL